MSEFRIEQEQVKTVVNTFEGVAKTIINARIQMANVQRMLLTMNESFKEVSDCLENMGTCLQQQAEDAATMQGTLRVISRKYGFTEMQIIGIVNLMKDDKFKVSGAWKQGEKAGELADGTKYNVNGSLLSGDAGVKIDGMGVEAYANGHGASGEATLESEYAKTTVSGSVANAEASVKVGMGMDAGADEDGSSSYMVIGAEASAAVNAAEGSVSTQLGTDDYNVHGEVSGSVVGADASASAGVYVEDGNTVASAKAEAEAYWAKGEVTQGFSIGGIKVDFTLEGMLGVQAEVGGSASLGGVSGDVGLGPIGLKVKIDWSGLF